MAPSSILEDLRKVAMDGDVEQEADNMVWYIRNMEMQVLCTGDGSAAFPLHVPVIQDIGFLVHNLGCDPVRQELEKDRDDIIALEVCYMCMCVYM